MIHDRVIPFARVRGLPCKGSLAEINTREPTMYQKRYMDGSIHTVYHVNMIDLLGRVFVHDGLKFLSLTQERFISRFFEACDKIREAEKEDVYEGVEEEFKALDLYLGGYVGVDDGQYTR